MTSGVKQPVEVAACKMIQRSRAHSKKVYRESSHFAKSPNVGEDDNYRVVSNPLRISHRFKELVIADSEVRAVVETVRNPKTGEFEDKVVHYWDDLVVFKMDGSRRPDGTPGMNCPKKEGWVVEKVLIACRGLRYLTHSVSPQKNQKLVCGSAHAQETVETHRTLVRNRKV